MAAPSAGQPESREEFEPLCGVTNFVVPNKNRCSNVASARIRSPFLRAGLVRGRHITGRNANQNKLQAMEPQENRRFLRRSTKAAGSHGLRELRAWPLRPKVLRCVGPTRARIGSNAHGQSIERRRQWTDQFLPWNLGSMGPRLVPGVSAPEATWSRLGSRSRSGSRPG
jgi:hypothetical protein